MQAQPELLADRAALSAARRSRDPRFDGVFFVGVTSTGIYCRPICRARYPREENVDYFANAAAAEARGFRPCLKCRPEAAPGSARWRGRAATVDRALTMIENGYFNGESVRLDGAIRMTPK